MRFGPVLEDAPLGGEGDVVWTDGAAHEVAGAPAAGDVDGDEVVDLVFLARSTAVDPCSGGSR